MNRSSSWLALAAVASLLPCAGQNCEITIAPGIDDDPDPPTFTVAPENLVLDCETDDVAADLADWLDSARATADPDCGPVAIAHDFSLSHTCDANGWVTTVTWTAKDTCNQTVTTSATVTIVNADAPVIDLTGENPVIIEVGVGTYTEPGATATIACGAATVPADVSGDVVDVDVPGTYTILYDAVDACGQAADQVTRTVHVVAPPGFTLIPDDLMLDCGEPDAADMLQDWLDSAEAEADPICGDVTITSEIVGLADDCDASGWTFAVEWTATDECGLSSTAMANLTILDPEEVTIALVGEEELTLECHVDEYAERGAMVTFGCDSISVPVTASGDEVDTGTPGVYVVTYELADDCGHSVGPIERTVTVVDTQAPTVTHGEMLELWPPNHKYTTLHLSDCVESVVDECEGEIDIDEAGTILSIYSDEPENSTGDGNTNDDVVIVDHSSFRLRAERRGGGDGRVYGISFEVTDSEGNTTTDTCFVGVPHDQSGRPPGDDGPAYTVTP